MALPVSIYDLIPLVAVATVLFPLAVVLRVIARGRAPAVGPETPEAE